MYFFQPNFEETFYSVKCGSCHEAIAASDALFHAAGGEEYFKVWTKFSNVKGIFGNLSQYQRGRTMLG